MSRTASTPTSERAPRKVPFLLVLIYTGVVAVCADVLVTIVHEIAGHCGAAVLVGGSAYAFYISPIGLGMAFAAMPDELPQIRTLLMVAGGVIGTWILIPFALVVVNRARRGPPAFLAYFVYFFVAWNTVAYAGLVPEIGRLTNSPGGDWGFVWRELQVPTWLPALCALVTLPIFMAHVSREVTAIANAWLLKDRHRDARSAFLLVLGPLVCIWAAAALLAWPWLGSYERWALPGKTLVLIGSVCLSWIGLAVLGRRDVVPRLERWMRLPPPTKREVAYWTLGGVLACGAIGAFFGPTSAMARAWMFGPVPPSAYSDADQRFELELDLTERDHAVLTLISYPQLDEGSPLFRQIAESALRSGPSAKRARGSAEFYAGQVFDTLGVISVGKAVRVHDSWRWTAVVSAEEQELTVSPSPSRLLAVSVYAPGAKLAGEAIDGLQVRGREGIFDWSRPKSMPEGTQFRIRLTRSAEEAAK